MSFKKNFSQAVDEISQKAAKVENPTSTGKENETAQADKEKAAIFTDQSVPVSVVAANDKSAGTTLTYITKDTTINGSVSTRGSRDILPPLKEVGASRSNSLMAAA